MVVLQDMFANLIASKISKLEAVKDTLRLSWTAFLAFSSSKAIWCACSKVIFSSP
jgi:hypothetical protein